LYIWAHTIPAAKKGMNKREKYMKGFVIDTAVTRTLKEISEPPSNANDREITLSAAI
jgi:hypothetical protein